MIAFVFLVCLIVLRVYSQAIAFNISSDVEGYYWRDFYGEIPSDALPGGLDNFGKPIYIGQVYAIFLIPAKIYSTDKKAYYEYGGLEHTTTQNIKILCTRHPEQFEWIKTNNDNIKLITEKHLVIGGYEPGTTTYIGRIRMEGEIAIGKALADNLPIFAGLHVTKSGRKKYHTSFEVLAFNKHTSIQNPSIDIRFSEQ